MRGKGSADVRTGQRTGITPAYAGKSPPAERSGPIRWDHPRVCGEKMDAATIQSGNAGSPPRMRGKDRRAVQGGIPAGITPAYAGKSPVVRERFLPAQDHPRVCGEKRSAGLGGRDGLGSPPRMRGKDRKDTDDAGIERITPAYAGKRQPDGQRRQLHRDHPRVCGEKSLPPRPMRAQRGSPPRMRGKENSSPKRLPTIGITPAYAGKSIRTRTGTSAPRGSPPHMRGKASCLYFRVPLTGITPAYAGKSYRERYGHHQGRDHPRICGEKSTRKRRTDSTLGSPPHMRGKVLSFVFRLNRDGITPAYAGKSHYPVLIPEERRDHPRICGEKLMPRPPFCPGRGSPPHMRGKVHSKHDPEDVVRITPAYAGKSAELRHNCGQSRDHPRICGEKQRQR